MCLGMWQVREQLGQTAEWDAPYAFLKAIDDKLRQKGDAWDEIANTQAHLQTLCVGSPLTWPHPSVHHTLPWCTVMCRRSTTDPFPPGMPSKHATSCCLCKTTPCRFVEICGHCTRIHMAATKVLFPLSDGMSHLHKKFLWQHPLLACARRRL